MDTGTVKTLLGLLSGSIITLIVKEIISQINRKVDFNREIYQITYQRKLEKAESAIAYYYTFVDRSMQLKTSLQLILKALEEIDDIDRDIEVIQKIIDESGKAITELASEKYFDVNAIHLYFDLDDADAWSEDDVENFLDVLSVANYHSNEVQLWINRQNYYSDNGETQAADQCWGKAMEIMPEYVASLQRVIELLEKNRKAGAAVIKKIKQQIKN